MERNLALEVVRVTEAAALASARLMGRGDADACDSAAIGAVRKAFASVEIAGEVVIGESRGLVDGALSVGATLGEGVENGAPRMDVVIDALEGRRLCATGLPNAISVVALAPAGQFLRAPATYMEKIAVGPRARGAIDLSLPPIDNLRRIADAKGVYIDDLTVCILDRPRHEELVEQIRRAGARMRLIQDGDVAGAVATCTPHSGIDVLMGIGGAQEGIAAAAAVRCAGGDLQGRLLPHDEVTRAETDALGGLDRIYRVEELAGDNVVFAATGVTTGDLLRGVRFRARGASTHSVVMRLASGTVRFIETEHTFDREPFYG
ncbi:MAG: class II fructose-bisphosphatase [Deltaproteobacteria bacterium]|nr:class II fructose-bisphosphatase [Deltaproteobacteria bacterium]